VENAIHWKIKVLPDSRLAAAHWVTFLKAENLYVKSMKPKAYCKANPHLFVWVDDPLAPGNGWITCTLPTGTLNDTKYQSQAMRMMHKGVAKSSKVDVRSYRKIRQPPAQYLPLFEEPHLRSPSLVVRNVGYRNRLTSQPRTFMKANRRHNKRPTVEESRLYAFMLTANEKKGASFKLAKFPDDSNARNWATHQVEPMVRSHSQAMANVIATDREFTLDNDEMEDLFLLLRPPNAEGDNPEEPHSRSNIYERIQSHATEKSREYFRTEVRLRVRKYREANSMLHGLIEMACAQNAEVHCFIKAKITSYTAEELQSLKGNALLREIVTKFHRDTPASLSLKLSEFHSMTLSHKYRNAHAFLVALEETGAELVRLGGIDSDKLPDLLTSRLVAGIRRRYESLAHSIELKRSEPDGITWDTVKALVRRIDIDAVSNGSIPFGEKRGRDSDKGSPHPRDRRPSSHQREKSPFKRDITCTFCGKRGHEESTCHSKTAPRTPTDPMKAYMPNSGNGNTAMKASKGKFHKKGGKFQSSPNRLHCRNCGGNHFPSQCNVTLAGVNHAKEASLPPGYFIPEDLQNVHTAETTPHQLRMLVNPHGSKYPHDQAEGSPTIRVVRRLNQAQEVLALLLQDVENKDISLERSLDECDFLHGRVSELNVLARKLPALSTSQLQRRSHIQTAINRVQEETETLKTSILYDIQRPYPSTGYEPGSVGSSLFGEIPDEDLILAGIIPSRTGRACSLHDAVPPVAKYNAPTGIARSLEDDTAPERACSPARKDGSYSGPFKMPKRKLSRESTPDVKRAKDPEDFIPAESSARFTPLQPSRHNDSASATPVDTRLVEQSQCRRASDPKVMHRVPKTPPLPTDNYDDVPFLINDDSDDEDEDNYAISRIPRKMKAAAEVLPVPTPRLDDDDDDDDLPDLICSDDESEDEPAIPRIPRKMRAAAIAPPVFTHRFADDEEDDEDGALEQGEERNLMLSATIESQRKDSIIDSGASQTAVKDQSLLRARRRRRQAVNTVGPPINVETSGPIGPFEDVFLIPVLSHNLISVKDLNDLGIKVTFEDGTMVLEYEGIVIMSTQSVDRVWTCDFAELCDKILAVMPESEIANRWWLRQHHALVSTRSKSKIATATPVEKAVEKEEEEAVDDSMRRSESRSRLIRLWHLRLCHRSEIMIVNEVNAGKLNIGVPRLSRKDISPNPCECCSKAKSHKLPRPARPVVKSTMALKKRVVNPAYKEGSDSQQGFGAGIISTDSCGPYTVASLIDGYVGNQNFMLMDSKKVFTYGYVNKTADNMIKNLKHLLDVEMKLLNLGVVRYHSDGAKELSGKEVKDFLAERGIRQTMSTPYTAQENAFIERHFGMEQEATVAMMMYARFLPKSLWFMAKQCYTYVYSLLPTQTARGRMSPEQYLTDEVPDLSHLRIYGSKAFINIPLSKRHKDFKDRAVTGYMIGYDQFFRGAYKFWIPEWNRFIISRDAKIDEAIPQGVIDFKEDTYWLEARQYGNRLTGKPRDRFDFEYLIGTVFYDPEMEEHYKVLNIALNRNNIVAGYARWKPEQDAQDDTEVGQMHVANVEQLLCPMNDAIAEALQCTSEGTKPLEPEIMEHSKTATQDGQRSLVDGGTSTGTPVGTHGALRRGLLVDELPTDAQDFQTSGELTSSQVSQQGMPARSIENMIDLPVSGDTGTQVSYAFATTFINECSTVDEEPSTYRQAVSGKHKKEWLLAIASELDSLRERGVLELIPLSRMNGSGRAVGARFVFKLKLKHGRIDKFKCRLVAKGFTLRPNIDYADAFSPVARTNSLRIFIKLSVDRGHYRISVDFKTAFLNSPLNEDLYLSPTEGMDCPPGHTYKLKRAIYGLPQAGRSWNSLLTELLLSKGLKQCISDPCIFVASGGELMVIVYVDDVIISSLHEEIGQTLVKDLESTFELGEKGPVDWYLGVAFDDQGSYLRMSQKDYVDKMLTKYEVDITRIEDTPMSDKTKLVKNTEDELDHNFDLKGKIGSLMYLAVCTRPDIAHAVSVIARMSNHPSNAVCNAVNHLFAYLNKNRDLGIVFVREENSEGNGYCDSDYAGDENDFKSTSGIVFFIGLTIVCWYSSKQSTTAQSSSDAEAIAMNFASKEVVWIRGLLSELGEDITLPTRMFGDNQAAIMLSKNPMFHKRTKHIMVKIFYLQEQVKESVIIWQYITTLLNIADMFTKALGRQRFLEARSRLRLGGPR